MVDLKSGQCVAIPTETVYGLAADATNGEAVARIFEMKERPTFNPLICHVNGVEMASRYGELNSIALLLAETFWPGPLTIVVPLLESSGISSLVTAGLDSIGLRHPKGISSDLIALFGKPLAAPSANKSGRISPTTAEHVKSEFENEELVIIDNGPCDVGLESTIVKVDDHSITMLRPGAVTADMIAEVTNISPTYPKSKKIEAPGMMQSHYAPDAKVILNFKERNTLDPAYAWLQFGPDCKEEDTKALNLSRNGDLIEAAANLYGMLKELDAAGPSTICVSPIPETGIGVAINDRLRRAAAPRESH